MSQGRLPRAYINDVPSDPKNTPQMEYVDFDKMGIGARRSGMPKEASKGPGSIEHVGGTAGGKR